MSSVTTCTTVCGEANPCSSNVGENTATCVLAGRPVPREAQVRERRAEQVRHGTSDEVLRRDPLVVPLGEREEEPGLFGRHPLHRVPAQVRDDSRGRRTASSP